MPIELDLVGIPPNPPQEQLPSVQFIAMGNSEDDCIICTESMSGKPVIGHINHIFHKSCITDWFTRNASCPICRASVTNAQQIRGSLHLEVYEEPAIAMNINEVEPVFDPIVAVIREVNRLLERINRFSNH